MFICVTRQAAVTLGHMSLLLGVALIIVKLLQVGILEEGGFLSAIHFYFELSSWQFMALLYRDVYSPECVQNSLILPAIKNIFLTFTCGDKRPF